MRLAAFFDDGSRFAAARAAGITVLECPAGEGVHAVAPRARSGAGRAPVPRIAPDGDDVAILMSTSGTTGRAKIVPSTHASVVHVARLQTRAIGPGDRFLVVTPLFTRNGLGLGLLSPLATGAAAILTPGFDAARFVDWLDALRPTCYTGSAAIHAAVIDAVLARHPEVREAATFGIAHPTLGEDVISAVVLREGSLASAMELRAFALRELPPAKAPSEVVLATSLPRNALGKVVRRALVDAGNAQSALPIPPLVRRARGASPNLTEGSAAAKTSIRGA